MRDDGTQRVSKKYTFSIPVCKYSSSVISAVAGRNAAGSAFTGSTLWKLVPVLFRDVTPLVCVRRRACKAYGEESEGDCFGCRARTPVSSLLSQCVLPSRSASQGRPCEMRLCITKSAARLWRPREERVGDSHAVDVDFEVFRETGVKFHGQLCAAAVAAPRLHVAVRN